MSLNFSLTPMQRLSLVNTYRWWFVPAHQVVFKEQQMRPCNQHDAEAVGIIPPPLITGVPNAMTSTPARMYGRPVMVRHTSWMEDAVLWTSPYKVNARRIWLNIPGGVKRFKVGDCFIPAAEQETFTKALATGANEELQEKFQNDETFWMQLKGNEDGKDTATSTEDV